MKKKRILAWSDAAVAGTGFGVVSKYVLRALHNTGLYDIHHLAINFHGDFVDKSDVPWQMQPARLLDPKDPHGIKMFARSLAKNEYDIVWILNDLYVTCEVAKIVLEIKQKYSSIGKKPPVFIYYYPVDCQVRPDSSAMLTACDIPVCYTNHGREETIKVRPEIKNILRQIPHGVDTKSFYPLPQEQIDKMRKSFFHVEKDTTVVMNINRNSTRKQIQYSMLAFQEFRKIVPDSIMYLHTAVRDQGGDLTKTIADLGMNDKTDIIFPTRFSPANPAPIYVLNSLYNTADIFLTTHLGEGWGLTITEAMAAGTPVVAPDNTCMREQLGEESERGYLYPCKDKIWIDNSGFRDKGLIPDIVEKMVQAKDCGKSDNRKIKAALEWTQKHTWNMICEEWIKLFYEVSNYDSRDISYEIMGEDV